MRHIPEALYATEGAVRFVKRGADPTKEHRAVFPPTDVSAEAHDRTVEVLDGIGASQ